MRLMRAMRFQTGLGLGSEKPCAAAIAILGIKALATEPCAKPLGVLRTGETESSRLRVPTGTERKSVTEFVDDVAVLSVT